MTKLTFTSIQVQEDHINQHGQNKVILSEEGEKQRNMTN